MLTPFFQTNRILLSHFCNIQWNFEGMKHLNRFILESRLWLTLFRSFNAIWWQFWKHFNDGRDENKCILRTVRISSGFDAQKWSYFTIDADWNTTFVIIGFLGIHYWNLMWALSMLTRSIFDFGDGIDSKEYKNTLRPKIETHERTKYENELRCFVSIHQNT